MRDCPPAPTRETTGPTQKGAVLVEMALMLPILLLFFVSLTEVSILIHDKAVITNASREGARFGISVVGSYATDAEIETWVAGYVAQRLITFGPESDVTTTVTRSGAVPGSALKVAVTYPYHFLALPGLNQSGLGPAFTLGAHTEMRLE